MINCIGLENPGIEYFKDNIIKNIKYSTPIILNINGATIDEYVKVAEIANEIERVDFIELNISCPNVKNGVLKMEEWHLEQAVKVLNLLQRL